MRTRQIRDTAAPRRGTTTRDGRRPRRLPVATALAAVMTVAGCAGLNDSGAGPDVTPGGADDVTEDVTEDAMTGDLPMLTIERAGGFVLVGTDFASVPELTVYPDGRAITHGPQIAIYPPPALPNLLSHDLDDDDVDALVAAARDAGLLDDVPADYGQPPVADAPTTFVTLRVDGQTYEHSAEALGISDGAGPAEGADGADAEEPLPEPGPPGDGLLDLGEAEREARAELAAFITRAHELVGTAGEGESYDIDAFAVMARPAPDPATGAQAEVPAEDELAGVSPAPDGLEPPVLEWPLDLALAEAQDCLVIEGEEARTVRDVLVGTVSTAQFEQAGARYDVWFRPLLPHEEDCSDV